MPDTLPLVAITLDSPDCWPASPQTLVNEITSKGAATLGDLGTGIIVSETEPVAADRDKVWIKVDGNGMVVGKWKYGSGVWHWPHDVAPLSNERRLWVGTEVELETYDGGAAGVVADAAGPMWQVDAAFAGRSPMAPGAITGLDPAKTLAVAEDYGNGGSKLVAADLPEHFHYVANADNIPTGGVLPTPVNYIAGSADYQGSGGTTENDYQLAGNATVPTIGRTSTFGSAVADQAALNVVHPVRGAYIIGRTARLYKTP